VHHLMILRTSPSPVFLPPALLLAVLALVAMPATGHAEGLAQTRVGASAVLATTGAGDSTLLAAVSQLGSGCDEGRPGALSRADLDPVNPLNIRYIP
jgi:hypothetical protein